MHLNACPLVISNIYRIESPNFMDFFCLIDEFLASPWIRGEGVSVADRPRVLQRLASFTKSRNEIRVSDTAESINRQI